MHPAFSIKSPESFMGQQFSTVMFSVNIPPPGLSAVPPADDLHLVLPFLWQLTKGDGCECGMRFSSLPALRAHPGATKGGQHGTYDSASRTNAVNWCLCCGVAFAKVVCARHHVRKSRSQCVCPGYSTCPIPCASKSQKRQHYLKCLELA